MIVRAAQLVLVLSLWVFSFLKRPLREKCPLIVGAEHRGARRVDYSRTEDVPVRSDSISHDSSTGIGTCNLFLTRSYACFGLPFLRFGLGLFTYFHEPLFLCGCSTFVRYRCSTLVRMGRFLGFGGGYHKFAYIRLFVPICEFGCSVAKGAKRKSLTTGDRIEDRNKYPSVDIANYNGLGRYCEFLKRVIPCQRRLCILTSNLER